MTEPDGPLRVSTLELFFDLVFVFTITQLTSVLARNDVTGAGALRMLLIFGVLWWMYGGYAWLTNTRTPSRTPERLLLLLGMAGFLVIGLAIPKAFEQRGEGLALGLGYLVASAVLGLALTASLWWAYFGVADDERAEDAFIRADPAVRPALALNAYWYAYIPMLLGIVALAAGIKLAMLRPGSGLPWPPSLALGGGVALFLAGDVAFRRALRIGRQRYRAAGAVACLAAWVVGLASSAAEIALLTLVVAGTLVVERRMAARDTV